VGDATGEKTMATKMGLGMERAELCSPDDGMTGILRRRGRSER
jgi:hypothetical protein